MNAWTTTASRPSSGRGPGVAPDGTRRPADPGTHEFRLLARLPVLTKGFDREPYYGEPDNPAYYPEQFELGGFAPLRAWNSIEINGREKLEALIAPWRKRHGSSSSGVTGSSRRRAWTSGRNGPRCTA